ncbi:TetR/AcrR family transcriptional regulator C-terminal domain-containing protein [Polymorphospora rubra]|uniref:TetR/AcrR family transcriptional regulator C-terminal domain-containing protein n=1 Tax=Polymorphospora rubra TaxID=338584 RepID=UPI003F4D4973
MENEAGAAPDYDRTLMLLWRRTLGEPQGSRGPRQRLSVDEVVRAGVAVADADGLETFSMRKVAERLGLGVMSIYTYVPGREELIGLMVDEVQGERELPELTGPLRERLARVARELWDEFHRHPWLLQVTHHRPFIGPNGADRYEWQLRAIEGIGFGDIEMDQIVNLVSGFAASAARASIEARRAHEISGITDEQWWEINGPILERIMDPGRYVVSDRVGTAAGEAYQAVSDPDLAFRFGLDRILDGIDLLAAARASDDIDRLSVPAGSLAVSVRPQRLENTMATQESAPQTDFPRSIGKVATRELAANGYTRFAQLTTTTPAELLKIHGVGKKSISILREELAERGLSFADGS